MRLWILSRTPAARNLHENDCGGSGLFVLMVAGISHLYAQVDSIFKQKYEERQVYDTPESFIVMGLRMNDDAK
jgi:hypothetical protein